MTTIDHRPSTAVHIHHDEKKRILGRKRAYVRRRQRVFDESYVPRDGMLAAYAFEHHLDVCGRDVGDPDFLAGYHGDGEIEKIGIETALRTGSHDDVFDLPTAEFETRLQHPIHVRRLRGGETISEIE